MESISFFCGSHTNNHPTAPLRQHHPGNGLRLGQSPGTGQWYDWRNPKPDIQTSGQIASSSHALGKLQVRPTLSGRLRSCALRSSTQWSKQHAIENPRRQQHAGIWDFETQMMGGGMCWFQATFSKLSWPYRKRRGVHQPGMIPSNPGNHKDLYIQQPVITHTIHVWYIYLRLVDFYCKCR